MSAPDTWSKTPPQGKPVIRRVNQILLREVSGLALQSGIAANARERYRSKIARAEVTEYAQVMGGYK